MNKGTCRMKKKVFTIPCEWALYGVLNIKAKNITEAIRLAKKQAETCVLPEGNYFDGSFQLNRDKDLIELLNRVKIRKER